MIISWFSPAFGWMVTSPDPPLHRFFPCKVRNFLPIFSIC